MSDHPDVPSSRGPSEAREPGTYEHRPREVSLWVFMGSGFAGSARAPE
jgi:hypothetical protein